MEPVVFRQDKLVFPPRSRRIYFGLVSFSSSDDERAAVLGPEIAHIPQDIPRTWS